MRRSRLTPQQQAASRLAVLGGCNLTSGMSAALVRGVLRRRRWSLHRHLHLVAAFEEARALAPIRSVLAVGCGAGLSELYLAATHPDVDFTLTDYDDEQRGRHPPRRQRSLAGQRRVPDPRPAGRARR